jgi:hypothetical protein
MSDSLTLIRTDLLKLYRRRGLMAIAVLIAVGSVVVMFAVNAARHGLNPAQVAPAGGVKTFENATDFLGMIGVVVAAIIGVTAGAGEAELGVLRDLVATGRSRVGLFASRTVAALALTLVVMSGALLVVTTLSIALAGSTHAPSLSEIVQRDAAVLGFGASAAIVCTGVATFARSRGPVMASVIAFGLLISQLLLHISFLGGLRALLPLAAFERAVGDSNPGLHVSVAVAVAVLVCWAVAALAAGGWWARRVEV